MSVNLRRRRAFLWIATGVTVAAAVAIPVGIVFGVKTKAGDEQVDKTNETSVLAAIPYGTDLQDAANIVFAPSEQSNYPTSLYEDPVIVDRGSFTPSTPAGQAGVTITVRYNSKDSSVTNKIVTYTLSVTKAYVPSTSDVLTTYDKYVFGGDLLTGAADFGVFGAGAEQRVGYTVVTDPEATENAPFFAKTATATVGDFPATAAAADDVNTYAKTLNVSANPQLFLIYTAVLDDNNYQLPSGTSANTIKVTIRIPVQPATATVHPDATNEYVDKFTYGDAAIPADTVPADYPDYDRTVTYQRISGTTTAAIVLADLPTVPAGDKIVATYAYAPNANYEGGQPFTVTNTYTVLPKTANAADVNVAVNLKYTGLLNQDFVQAVSVADLKIPTASDVPDGYDKTIGNPQYHVLTTVSAPAAEADPSFTYTIGQDFAATNDQFVAFLKVLPYGSVITRTFTFAPADNYTGDDFTYTITYSIGEQLAVSGTANTDALDMRAGTNDLVVKDFATLVPQVKGVTYYEIEYKVTVDGDTTDTFDVDDTLTEAEARALPPGYAFTQTYKSRLTNGNYKLADNAVLSSWTVTWTVVAQSTSYVFRETAQTPSFATAPAATQYAKPAQAEGYDDWATPTIVVTKGLASTANNYNASFKTDDTLNASQLALAPAGTEYEVRYVAKADANHAGSPDAKHTFPFVVQKKLVTPTQVVTGLADSFAKATIGESFDAVAKVEGFTYSTLPAYFVHSVPTGGTDYTVGQPITKAEAENLKPGYAFRQVYTAQLTNDNYASSIAGGLQTHAYTSLRRAIAATPTNKTTAHAATYGTAPATTTYAKEAKVDGYNDWTGPVLKVTKGIDDTNANNYVEAFTTGKTIVESQLKDIPAGVQYEVRYTATADDYHSGADSTLIYNFTVGEKALDYAEVTLQISDTDYTTARVVSGSSTLTPIPFSAFTAVDPDFDLDTAVDVFYRITNVPAAALPTDPQQDEEIAGDAAGLAKLANLKVGYRFKQVYTAKIRSGATDNYVASTTGPKTYTIEWVVDAAPTVKNINVFEGETNFADTILKAAENTYPLDNPLTHGDWIWVSLTRKDSSNAAMNIDITSTAELNSALTDALFGRRVITQTFVSKNKTAGVRDTIQKFVVNYEAKVDVSTWRLTLTRSAGGQTIEAGGITTLFPFTLTFQTTGDSRAAPSLDALKLNIVQATDNGATLSNPGLLFGSNATFKAVGPLVITFKITDITLKSLGLRGFLRDLGGPLAVGTDSKLEAVEFASGKGTTGSGSARKGAAPSENSSFYINAAFGNVKLGDSKKDLVFPSAVPTTPPTTPASTAK